MLRYKRKSNSCVNPYHELFIYNMEGSLNPGLKGLGEHFIGNWEDGGYSFLFFSHPADVIVENLLKVQDGLKLIDSFQMSYQQWMGEKIKPYRQGRFVISSPWDNVDDFFQCSDDDIHIVIDPNVVFGTGTHPTTSDCLALLEHVFEHETVIRCMIDLGTGTGILAMASASLGCPRNIAIDFNYLAAKTAIKNVFMNDMKGKVHVVQGRAEDFIDISAELVVANIHYDVMKILIEKKDFLKKKYFILSGLMTSEADEVLKRLNDMPVRILEKRKNDMWWSFLGENERM